MSKQKRPPARSNGSSNAAATTARSTVSRPSRGGGKSTNDDALVAKMVSAATLAAGMPFNAQKAGEYGKPSLEPSVGATVDVPDSRATGSTLTESEGSPKNGKGEVHPGLNPGNLPLDRVRVDSSGRTLLPTGAPDPGVIVGRHAGAGDLLARFVMAVGKHRHHEREMDPPAV